MRACIRGFLTIVVFTFVASPAVGQDAKAVEVTPFVALGSTGASPFGVAIVFPVTSTLDIETEVGYRRGEGRIHALSSSTSLLWNLPRVGRVAPYLAAGVGLAQYGAPVLSPGGYPIATQSRTAVTVNAGGGLKPGSMTRWTCGPMPGGSVVRSSRIGALSRGSGRRLRRRQTVISGHRPKAAAAYFLFR